MSRFLLAFVKNSNSGLPYSQEVFKVSENCLASDVTVPFNTVCFMFVHADTDSVKDFSESFVTLKLNNALMVHCSVNMAPEENGKKYWVGQLIPFGNSKGILNTNLKAIFPISCLGKNDEVIDL